MKPAITSRSLVMASVLATSVAVAQTNAQGTLSPVKVDEAPPVSKNRFGLSYRMGFNISARFRNLGGYAALSNPGPTPTGAPSKSLWNYDNGYNLDDAPGTPPGMTWYWGYSGVPSKAAQNPGDGFLYLSRSSSPADVSSSAEADPQLGFELTYNRELGTIGHARWGLEGAVNYMRVDLHDDRTLHGTIVTRTDAFSTMGTIIPDPPYYGPKTAPVPGGPNQPVISDTPDPQRSLTSSTAGGTTITGSRKIEADIYGFRVGPYLEFPLYEKLSLAFSGGLSLASVNSRFKYNETVDVPGAGTGTSVGAGSRSDLLIGGYAAANLTYSFSKSWSASAGAQFQDLGCVSQRVGGTAAELDLSKSIFVTIGFGYSF